MKKFLGIPLGLFLLTLVTTIVGIAYSMATAWGAREALQCVYVGGAALVVELVLAWTGQFSKASDKAAGISGKGQGR